MRRPAGRLHAELLQNQHLAPEQVDALTERRSADIVRYAMSSTEFYADCYRAVGVRPEDLDEPGVLAELPVIDRSEMKARAPEFWSRDVDPKAIRDARTGGSTGEPLRMGQDARVPLLPLAWRMYSWWGVAPHDNLARIARWSAGRRALLSNGLQWWPSRHAYLEAALIDQASMATLGLDPGLWTRGCRITRPAGA